MKLFEKIDAALVLLGAVALVVIVVVTTVDVLSANLRGRPIAGIYEVVEAALVFVVFLGMPLIFRTERNIAVDIVDNVVRPRTVRRLRMGAAALSAAFLVVLLVCMWTPAAETWLYGDRKPDTGIPLWFMWIPVLGGMGLAAIAAVAVFVAHFRAAFADGEEAGS